MKYKITLEIAPIKLRQLIDLVSDAQNTYAERLTMKLCYPCRTSEESEQRSQDITFLTCRYNEYTDLLLTLQRCVFENNKHVILADASDFDN